MFEQQFINFMEKFDSVPFTIKTQDHTYQIGKGEPTFSVTKCQACLICLPALLLP